MRDRHFRVLVVPVVALIAGCTSSPAVTSAPPTPQASPSVTIIPTPEVSDEPEVADGGKVNRWVTRRPGWLGKRVLPPGSSGFGQVRPTPPLLRNRRLATIDLFPPPRNDRFDSSIGPVPRAVVKRSTWRPACPVTLDQLRYLKMSFIGFDRRPHTGEMIVNAAVAEQIVHVFRQMFRARFPIEEMRVVTLREQRRWHTAPTGDTNVTSSFECRKATLGSSWSEHSYGLAIDINPFHNPYARGDLVAPELAGAYVDRNWRRPGMVLEGDAVTQAFDDIGWGWGGRWNSLKDWMHFSQSGH
jgi:D-alanyl-D-alanine carboxypeptidase